MTLAIVQWGKGYTHPHSEDVDHDGAIRHSGTFSLDDSSPRVSQGDIATSGDLFPLPDIDDGISKSIDMEDIKHSPSSSSGDGGATGGGSGLKGGPKTGWAEKCRMGHEHEVVRIFCGTWNMGDAPPPSSLQKWIPRGVHDLYVIAVQECEYTPRAPHETCESDWFGAVQDHLGRRYVKVAGTSLLSIRLVVLVRREMYYQVHMLSNF